MLRSKDSFTEAYDPRGHLKKMLSGSMLNGFQKNGIPDHELILKVNNICLVTCAINVLGLANNSRIHIVAIHWHCVEVLTVGDCAECNIRIPCISLKFRYPMGSHSSLQDCNFLCVWHTP
jgi:hypothetical protein